MSQYKAARLDIALHCRQVARQSHRPHHMRHHLHQPNSTLRTPRPGTGIALDEYDGHDQIRGETVLSAVPIDRRYDPSPFRQRKRRISEREASLQSAPHSGTRNDRLLRREFTASQ